jgi:hypothetical protein
MTNKTTTKPEALTDEMLVFLDDLRESGVTNMYGARPYIEGAFPDLSTMQAADVLRYWMAIFGERRAAAEANARLIAAAPDLLKALKQAREALVDFAAHSNEPCGEYDDGTCACGLNDAIIEADAAIAKAQR